LKAKIRQALLWQFSVLAGLRTIVFVQLLLILQEQNTAIKKLW
jgi:hypothetical protein